MTIKHGLQWLWKASRHYRLPVAGNALLGAAYVAVSLFWVYVCKHLIDIVTGHSGDRLGTYVGWMIGCMAAQLALSAVRSRWVSRAETDMCNEVRQRLFSHLMAARWQGRETFHSGDVLNRLEEDARTVTGAWCRMVPACFVTVCQLAGALLFLAGLDSRLAGIVLFIMPLALLFSKAYVRRMRQLSRDIRQSDSAVQSHLQEYLQHRVLIRTLEYTDRAMGALVGLQARLLREVMRRTDFAVFSRSMVQLGFAAGYVTAFLWGIFGLREGTVTFGMMTAFLQLVAQVQRPVVDLSRQVPAFVRVFTAVERLAELSGLPVEQEGKQIRLQGQAGIRFEAVSFAYPAGAPVLDAYSHDFAPGSLTAVLGETGTGKSTLMRLVLALLLPDSGRVVFYDACREVEASPLTRCNLAYVPQGNTLLSGTIRDNLRMGKPDASEDELREALHTAVADFVYALPQGLDTPCGEQGTGISEGQAQRIAIARGLLREGSILLLDEPTSSLDAETEKLLLERLARRVRGKTLLLITHREATAQLCTSVTRLSHAP